jgi:DNA-binding CsgD family transcriptional regulator
VLADKATLNALMGATDSMEQALQALAIAREVDDPALLLRALTACGASAVYDPEVARPYFAEAIGLARSIGDGWRLSQILAWQAFGGVMVGDPIAVRAAAEEGRDLGDAIGDRFASHGCRWNLGCAQGMTGDVVGAVAQLREVVAEADAAHDVYWGCCALFMQAVMLAYHGDPSAARESANAAVDSAGELGGFFPGLAYAGLTVATLAGGDVAAAEDAIAAALPHLSLQPKMAAIWIAYAAQAALARGDLTAARRLADDAVAATSGFHLSLALTTRAGVAIAQGQPEQADRDAQDALATAVSAGAYGATPETLECLAALAVGAGGHREAARLFGAADAIRQRGGLVRFKIFDAFFEFPVSALRDGMGEKDFESAWAEGASLSTDEAIAYARRRRGERKRPRSGWASLTPTERDVIRLVSEGLANNDIATRLFVSPRTVQTHLTHVYTKLGLTSRVQLAQEAARHG